MKQGSLYAKRIQRLHQALLKQYGKPPLVDSIDPLDQMLIGILADDTSYAKAQAVYRKVMSQMVDLNDLRVTPAVELARQIGDDVPYAVQKARRIVGALNDVRRRQDTLKLSFLEQRGRREAREYLESLEGVGKGGAAYVVLFSLGGHAIPVDLLTLYVLRKEGYVNATASPEEVQSFLERHINAADVAEFVVLLGKFVAAQGSRVPLAKLAELVKPPPPPAPKVTPKPEAVPVPDDKAKAAADVKPAPGAKVKPKPKADAKGKPDVAPKIEGKPEPAAKPDAKAKADTAPKPETKSKTESAAKPKPEPDVKPDVKAKPDAAPKPDASARTRRK